MSTKMEFHHFLHRRHYYHRLSAPAANHLQSLSNLLLSQFEFRCQYLLRALRRTKQPRSQGHLILVCASLLIHSFALTREALIPSRAISRFLKVKMVNLGANHEGYSAPVGVLALDRGRYLYGEEDNYCIEIGQLAIARLVVEKTILNPDQTYALRGQFFQKLDSRLKQNFGFRYPLYSV